MVRCMDCAHKIDPAITWRGDVFRGWVQCRLGQSEPEGRARYLSPVYARECERFRMVP